MCNQRCICFDPQVPLRCDAYAGSKASKARTVPVFSCSECVCAVVNVDDVNRRLRHCPHDAKPKG